MKKSLVFAIVVAALTNCVDKNEERSLSTSDSKAISRHSPNTAEADVIEMLAAHACDRDTGELERLVQLGGNVNSQAANEATPLAMAIDCRNMDGIRLLLENGADPNFEFLQTNAVIMASRLTDPEILRLLLQYGGDPDGVEWFKGGPLSEALYAGQVDGNWENLDILIESGADINVAPGNSSIVERMVRTGKFDKASMMLRKGYSFRLDYLAWTAQGYPFGADEFVSEYRIKARDKFLELLRDEYGIPIPLQQEPESAPVYFILPKKKEGD